MKGKKSSHKLVEHIDPVTRRVIRQLTSQPGSHHHLYFTSNSFSKDNNSILFINNFADNINICKLSLYDGETVQLTNNEDGYLQSYVYYDGNKCRGLGKASVSYQPDTNQVLYILGREVRILDVDTLEEEVISILPKDVITGFTHISSDGMYACIPYVHSDAFNVPNNNHMRRIKNKIESQSMESRVLVVNIRSRQSDVAFSHVGWITHVQFHPNNHEHILFNHEGGDVFQRIWLYHNGWIEKIRDQSIEEDPIWICHEVWSHDGEAIFYHGTKTPKGEANPVARSFIGRYNTREDTYVEVLFPEEMNHYGHFTVGENMSLLLTDGIIDNELIHSVHVDWEHESLAWTPLCHHGSSFCLQDVHPHPVFDHVNKRVLFSSDAHGAPGVANIYVLDADESTA